MNEFKRERAGEDARRDSAVYFFDGDCCYTVDRGGYNSPRPYVSEEEREERAWKDRQRKLREDER